MNSSATTESPDAVSAPESADKIPADKTPADKIEAGRLSEGTGQLPAEDAAPEDYSNEPGAHIWRLGAGDMLAGGASIVLLGSQFLPWFSSSSRLAIPRGRIAKPVHFDAFGAGGWHWITVLLALGLIGYLAARTYPGEGRHIPLPHWQLMASLTGTNLLIVVLGMLMPPDRGHWGVAYGAVIALLAALCAVGGAFIRRAEPELMCPPPYAADESVLEQEPLPAVAEEEPLPAVDEERPARPRTRGNRRPEHRAARHSARARATARRYEGADGDPGLEQAARRGTYEPTGKMCMICGAENAESRRVCKTCGVSLLSRAR